MAERPERPFGQDGPSARWPLSRESMSRLAHRVRHLLRTIFRRHAVEDDLDDELRDWIETLAERHAANGLAPDAARRAALREMDDTGAIHRLKARVHGLRNGSRIDSLLLDLRYGWRALWKAPGLAVVIIITLALGIGANTAIFSVVHAMLVAPLPYRDADRLLFVWLDATSMDYPRWPLAGPDLRALRDGSRTCEGFAAIWSNTAALTGDDPEQLRIGFVTTPFFRVLGAEPALGRTFREEDGVKGAEPTILIGWELFQRRFGGDTSIVGRQILVDDRPTTVVGVMPRDFRLLLPPDASVPDHLQAWLPFWYDVERSQNFFLRVVGRMRPGVTLGEARAEIAAIGSRVRVPRQANRTFSTVALQADDVREIRGPLLALFAGVGILLMIACVNVASLLIARAAARTREIALRLALGASRGRLLRQSLVEGLLLTMLGAAAGMMAGYAGLRVLLAMAPDTLSRLSASRLDVNVFAFTLVTSTVWGLLCSCAPFTELLKVDAGATLQQQSRVPGAHLRYRTRATLVTLQIASSLVLLVGAGLLVRAFVEVLRVDPGFRTDRHVTFRMRIPDRYEDSTASFNAFARAVQRRLAAMPGVTGVGAISHVPYDDLPNWAVRYSLVSPRPADAPSTDTRAISTGLFETLGVRLLEGRHFTEADEDPHNQVAIVDDKLATQLWPNRSAIGQRLFLQEGDATTIVGVVPHLKLRSLVEDLNPQIFVPWRIAQRNPIAWVVRTDRDPSTLDAEIRAAVAAVDGRVPIYDVRSMETYVEAARSTRRFTMLLAAAFAVAALALTCVGVYGVLAYAVAHRRHEFGVRRALGANAPQVMRELLREALGFAAIGCVVGLAGALIAARLLQNQLYAVHPRDPLTFGAAIAIILGGAIAACAIPAWRATTVSPLEALRGE